MTRLRLQFLLRRYPRRPPPSPDLIVFRDPVVDLRRRTGPLWRIAVSLELERNRTRVLEFVSRIGDRRPGTAHQRLWSQAAPPPGGADTSRLFVSGIAACLPPPAG